MFVFAVCATDKACKDAELVHLVVAVTANPLIFFFTTHTRAHAPDVRPKQGRLFDVTKCLLFSLGEKWTEKKREERLCVCAVEDGDPLAFYITCELLLRGRASRRNPMRGLWLAIEYAAHLPLELRDGVRRSDAAAARDKSVLA